MKNHLNCQLFHLFAPFAFQSISKIENKVIIVKNREEISKIYWESTQAFDGVSCDCDILLNNKFSHGIYFQISHNSKF